MRDLKALLDSQEVDRDDNTIQRALELNGELAKLKEETKKLKKEIRFRKDKERLYLEELEQREEQLQASEAESKRLKEETRRMKVSLDSVFKDLEASKELVLKLRKERWEIQFGQEGNLSDRDLKEESQGELLSSAVEKPAQSHALFSSSMGGANSTQHQKIRNLENENLKLKSELVRLQSQCREERYLNRRVIFEEVAGENATCATASLDGSCSLNSASDDGHSGRTNLAQSNSLRRIKEYKERKASLPTHIIPPAASTVRQPRRIGSLRSNFYLGSRMIDSNVDDQPSALHGAPKGAQLIQSLWPGGAKGDRSPLSRATTSSMIPRPPRGVQSLQPSSLERQQMNLHEVGQDEPSRGILLGRSQEGTKRMGWWQ